MIRGLLAAGLAAVLYGVASVFQAIAARRTASAEGVDPRVLIRVVGQPWFLAGLAADGAGFAAQFWALQTLPIFVVQSALAASLAVTAVVAVPMLGLVLTGRHWAAVGGVCTGLVLLGLSAGAENVYVPSLVFQFALIGGVTLLAVAMFARMRAPSKRPGAGAERLPEVPLILSRDESKMVVAPLMVSSMCQSSLVSDSTASVMFDSSTMRIATEADPRLEDITSCPLLNGASAATVSWTLA